MKKILLIFMLLTIFKIFSLENYIGYSPEKIISKIGSPTYVLSQRGDREEEDDVLFFYNDRVYVYFNQNRVWQVRVDKKYSGDVLGVEIGYTRAQVIDILGEPIENSDNSLVYRRPDMGYPIILRIYFSGEEVNDIYFFRGDY